jgi:PAS domain S-box-containing protein
MENELGSVGSLVPVLDSMGDAVIATDTEGKIKLMNPAAEALTGWTRQDALDKDVMEVFQITPEDTGLPVESPGKKALREGVATSLAQHTLLTIQGGTGIPVTGSAAPIRDNGGSITGVVWVLHHATEHTQAHRALQETFEKVEQAKREWESAIDALPDLVCLVDDQGCLIRANRAVEAWNLGPVVEVKGRELHDFLHPECADPDCYLDSLLKPVVERTLSQPINQEVFDPVLKRHLLVNLCPVLDRNHRITQSVVVVMQDITERKRVEQEREKLIQELDAFAHTVAHDLKNPVGLVIGFAELEQSFGTTSSDELQQSLRVIARIGHKMNNIIDELLLLAGVRKTKVDAKPLNMANIVAEAQQRLTDMIQEYRATIVLPDAWPAALGHAPWIEEVWVNYLSNAFKYGGRPPHLELGATVQEDGMVHFWVHDNGSGLTPEERRRMFVPFTRLNQARATGHGLGLSIAQRILEKLDGQVGVESSGVAGQGSVFYFTLPSATPGPMDKQNVS